MGICSRVLFLHLANDLSGALSTVPWGDLADFKAVVNPWPGISSRQFAALALRSSLLKKFEDIQASDADVKALQKFLEANERCSRFLDFDRDEITEIEEIGLGEFSSAFSSFFYYDHDTPILSTYDVCANVGVGPGSSIKATGQSYYHKVAASPMSGTSKSLYLLYKEGVAAKYHLEHEVESTRSQLCGEFALVQGNSLSFVPKTSEISRTICTEPLLNMMFQKGIASVFESRLEERYGISLKIQPDKNRALAKIGSEDGSYGTIDLASASDSISLGLLRKCLPKSILTWLMRTRSPCVTLPDGSELPLQMVSSMGNAFTFPLQTILFASVVVGAYRSLGITPIFPHGKTIGNFSVFGDDIVVRKDAYWLVVSILKRIGFLVNDDKSFNTGPFRESCGADFWSGFPVRGVYCRTLRSMQDRYSLINRLNIWSTNQGISLSSIIGYLLGSVKFLPVPIWDSDVAGVKVPLELVVHKRTSKRYQGSILYERYMPRSEQLSLVSVGDRPTVNGRVKHNPAGILLSAVSGYLRSGCILFRMRHTRYIKRLAVAPCWDYDDPSHPRLSDVGWRRWYIYASLNLGMV